MAKIASPGHKLGQMIGNFFEDLFAEDFINLSKKHGLYCDCKAQRASISIKQKKVTWTDKDSNKHDLDYVFERGRTQHERGAPVAFVELAWRRYTKHSRNKTGELEAALLPLRDTYLTCGFLGAIIAGEYTEGGKNQLTSHGITILHIPFDILATSFRAHGIELNYPETAPDEVKIKPLKKWQSLTKKKVATIKNDLRKAMASDYDSFMSQLEKALLRKVALVRIFPLYTRELVFRSVHDAIDALTSFEDFGDTGCHLLKFEVQLRFSNGDEGQFTFADKVDALHFLRMFT